MESDSSLQLAFLEISETRHRLPDVQRKSGGCPTMFRFVRIALTKTSGMSGNPSDRHVYTMFMTTTTTIVAYYMGISCEGNTCHLGGTHLILSWFKARPVHSPFFQICQKFVQFFCGGRITLKTFASFCMVIDHNPDHSSPCASQWHFIWSFDAHVVQILIQATVVVIEGWGYTIHWQCVSIGLQQIPQPNKTGKLLPCIYNLHTWIMMWSQFSQAADCTWQNKTTRKCKQKPMKTLYIIIFIWIYKHETSTSSKAPYVRRPSV